MAETTNHADAFSEKSKLLNIALKYTNGDMERAKFMVSGQYNDVKVIKGKFELEETSNYGLLLLFINLPNKYVMHNDVILTPDSAIVSKASIFDSWKSFHSDLSDYLNSAANNLLPSYDFNKYLSDSIDNNIYTDIENDNLENLTKIITNILKKFYSSERINCQLNIDNTNSLSMELANVQISEAKKPGDIDEQEKIDAEFSQKVADIESKYDRVLSGRIIISPIKGKHISEIKPGEKIKVLFTSNDKMNQQIAKSLNSLSEDNEILPVSMRVTDKLPIDKKGYYIYGLVAKNILVKIIEEEDVKIETDATQKLSKSSNKEKDGSNKTMIYIVLLVGLLLVIIFLILIIL